MTSCWLKPTSLVLGTYYALMACFAHALHDHGHESHEHEAVHATCSCGHDHAVCHTTERPHSTTTAADAVRPSLRSVVQHDACACAACALIAQLSVGFAGAQGRLLTTWVASGFVAVVCESPCFAVRVGSSSERGPPLGAASS